MVKNRMILSETNNKVSLHFFNMYDVSLHIFSLRHIHVPNQQTDMPLLWYARHACVFTEQVCCAPNADSRRYQSESLQKLDNYDTINEEKRRADEEEADAREDTTNFNY